MSQENVEIARFFEALNNWLDLYWSDPGIPSNRHKATRSSTA
jgi:hypothetical protein